MDIRQLKYFIEIVKSGFNLSTASTKLNISQPALSMTIKKFESEEKVDIFTRHKGLIIGLSPTGEAFYNKALSVVSQFDCMLAEVRYQSSFLNGSFRIGIPPLVLTLVWTEFLNLLVNKYSQVNFIVSENGAYELERKLLLGEIDCAVLLHPINLDPQKFGEILINKDELSAFMSKNHPLAKKTALKWEDLSGNSIVMFDDSYMIHHKMMQVLDTHHLNVHIAMMSKSWDFLLESVRNSRYITILPSPITRFYNLEDIAEVRFEDPIPWEVVYVYPFKKIYSHIEQTMYQEINQFFLKTDQ